MRSGVGYRISNENRVRYTIPMKPRRNNRYDSDKKNNYLIRFRYLQHDRICRTRRRKMHGNARGRKATHVRDIYGYLRYIESSIYRKISYDILSVRHLDIPKLSILCIERSIFHISIYRNFLYIRYPTLL